MLFWENKIPFIFKKFWKLIILIFGSIVTILGVIMLFTPGQGLATIIIGLSILATEFIWAKNLNIKLKNYLKNKGKEVKSYFKEGENDNH